MVYSVLDISRYPSAYVRSFDARRAAQIAARLLRERFPFASFSYIEGGAFGHPDAAPAMRDSATSFEVEELVREELRRERLDNPQDFAKWRIFGYDAKPGKISAVSAYLDHDLPTVTKCLKDPELQGLGEFFGEYPTSADMAEIFPELVNVA